MLRCGHVAGPTGRAGEHERFCKGTVPCSSIELKSYVSRCPRNPQSSDVPRAPRPCMAETHPLQSPEGATDGSPGWRHGLAGPEPWVLELPPHPPFSPAARRSGRKPRPAGGGGNVNGGSCSSEPRTWPEAGRRPGLFSAVPSGLGGSTRLPTTKPGPKRVPPWAKRSARLAICRPCGDCLHSFVHAGSSDKANLTHYTSPDCQADGLDTGGFVTSVRGGRIRLWEVASANTLRMSDRSNDHKCEF